MITCRVAIPGANGSKYRRPKWCDTVSRPVESKAHTFAESTSAALAPDPVNISRSQIETGLFTSAPAGSGSRYKIPCNLLDGRNPNVFFAPPRRRELSLAGLYSEQVSQASLNLTRNLPELCMFRHGLRGDNANRK